MTDPAITEALTDTNERVAATGTGAAQLVTVVNDIHMQEAESEIKFLCEQRERQGAIVFSHADAPGGRARPAQPWEGARWLLHGLTELAGGQLAPIGSLDKNPLTWLAERDQAVAAISNDAQPVLAAAAATGAIPTDTISPWQAVLTRAVTATIVDRIAATAKRRSKAVTIIAHKLNEWDSASQNVIAALAEAAQRDGFHLIATHLSVAPDDPVPAHLRAPFACIDIDSYHMNTLAISTMFQIAPLPGELRELLGAAAAVGTAWNTRLLARHGFDRDRVIDLLRSAPGAKTSELLHPAVDLDGLLICAFTSLETRHGALLAATPEQRETWFDTEADTILAGRAPEMLSVDDQLRYAAVATSAGPVHRDRAVPLLLEHAARAWVALAPADAIRFAEGALTVLDDHPSADPRAAAWRSTAGRWCLLALDRPDDIDPDILNAWFDDAATAGEIDVQLLLARARLSPPVLGLDVQLEHLKAAWEAAQQPDTEPALHQAALVCYARQWAKRDLAGARSLLDAGGRVLPNEGDGSLAVWRALTGLYEGVLAFDAGQLDQADNLVALHRSELGATCRALEGICANFAAQIAAALGDTIRAETILAGACAADDALGLDGPWQAYNRALRADLATRIDPAHPDARAWAETAWASINAHGHPNLLPLIGLHRAETFLRTVGDDRAALEDALSAAVDMDAWGDDHDQPRIRIMALALCADVHTRRGNRAAADLASETALGLLESTGPAPALNLVEALYRCALGRPTRAERDRVMDRAREAVTARESGIESPYRLATYRAHPLTRAVTNQ